MNEIETRLVPIRRRIRARDGWIGLQLSLWIPAAAALIIQIMGRLWPIPQLWIWSLAPIGIWLAVLVGYYLLKPMPWDQTARRTDVELSLKERISTSLALQPMLEANQINNLLVRQRLDALDHLSAINPSKAFPFQWLKKPVLVGTLLLMLAFFSNFIPNPMNARLQEQAAIRQAVQEQAERIEKLREEAADNEELTPETREKLLKELDELAKALQENRGELDQAIADLNRFEAQARMGLDPDLGSQQALHEALTQQLTRMADQNQSTSSVEDAQQALENLIDQAESMDEAELEQLARELAMLAAQAAQAGDQATSTALSELAESLLDGDLTAAQAAAINANAALSQLNQNLANNAAVQAVIDQSQASEQALVQAGRQAAQQSQGQQAASTGQNASSASGQSPGQLPSQGQTGGSGGGTKANTLPPATGGRTTLRSPQGDSPRVEEGLLDQSIYAPWQRTGENGEQLFIPGQNTDQGQSSTTEGQGHNPGLNNPALVPYYQVFPQYLTAANQAMETSYIPANLIDYVRQYFSSLDPK